MKHILALILSMLAAGAAQAEEAPGIGHSAYHDFRIVTVAGGLERPWAIAFLPGGDMLVTEKGGRLRIVRDGELLPEPVSGVPKVFSVGQGGLLDVLAHPGFEDNRLLYFSYSKPLGEGESTTVVARGRLEERRLFGVQELLQAVSEGRGHYGSRLAFDGKGHVFVTLGDRQASPTGDLEAHPSQNLMSHQGTVVRLNEDGSVPSDNPFIGRDDALPEIWTWGHRNVQGLVIDRETGDVWITEHGPQGGDELNLLSPGANYGWPVIGYGVHYGSGEAIHPGTHREGMEQPVKIWVPSIGTSGLAMYEGDAFPHWRGSLLAGGLSGQRITLLHMEGHNVVREEELLRGRGRVRDVKIGPDGFVYVVIDDRDGKPTPILRLEPVPRGELDVP